MTTASQSKRQAGETGPEQQHGRGFGCRRIRGKARNSHQESPAPGTVAQSEEYGGVLDTFEPGEDQDVAAMGHFIDDHARRSRLRTSRCAAGPSPAQS